MATVRFARHGETAWNRAGRVQGWAPTRLTDRGRDQADALATRPDRPPDRLVASDLPRAVETAERLAAATGRAVETDERWRERDWGRLQGLSAAGLYERFPRFSLMDGDAAEAMAARPEGGESLRAVQARVLDAWGDLRAALSPDATAVVVTHAVPICVVVAAAAERDPAAVLRDCAPETGTTVDLRVTDGEATVVDEVSDRDLPVRG